MGLLKLLAVGARKYIYCSILSKILDRVDIKDKISIIAALILYMEDLIKKHRIHFDN